MRLACVYPFVLCENDVVFFVRSGVQRSAATVTGTVVLRVCVYLYFEKAMTFHVTYCCSIYSTRGESVDTYIPCTRIERPDFPRVGVFFGSASEGLDAS